MKKNIFQSVLIGTIAFALGSMFVICLGYIGELKTQNYISIVTIAINIIFGLIVIFAIRKKLLDDRAVKDFFTKILEKKIDKYELFIQDVFNGKQNSRLILNWYKDMSMEIIQLEYFLKRDLKIKNLDLQKLSRELHVFITDSKTFNDSYSASNITFSSKFNRDLRDKYKNLNHCFVSTILSVNRS